MKLVKWSETIRTVSGASGKRFEPLGERDDGYMINQAITAAIWSFGGNSRAIYSSITFAIHLFRRERVYQQKEKDNNRSHRQNGDVVGCLRSDKENCLYTHMNHEFF